MTKPLLPPFNDIKENKKGVHLKCMEKLDVFIKSANTSFDRKLYREQYHTFENKRFLKQPEYGFKITSDAVNYGMSFSSQVFGDNTEEQTYFWANQSLCREYIVTGINKHISQYVSQYNDYYTDSSIKSFVETSIDFMNYSVYFIYQEIKPKGR